MHIKLILVGIGSIMFGIIGVWSSLANLAACANIKPDTILFAILRSDDPCKIQNYADGTLGVFLLIRIVLLITGIIKKSPQPIHNL